MVLRGPFSGSENLLLKHEDLTRILTPTFKVKQNKKQEWVAICDCIPSAMGTETGESLHLYDLQSSSRFSKKLYLN